MKGHPIRILGSRAALRRSARRFIRTNVMAKMKISICTVGISDAQDRTERQAAKTVDGKDGFGDDRTAEFLAQLNRENTDDRQQRVAHGMAMEQVVSAISLGPGGADIIGIHDFDQASARQPHHGGHGRRAQHEGRQDEVAPGLSPETGKIGNITPNKMIMISPSQKLGMAWADTAMSSANRSAQELGLSAAMAPSGMAMTMVDHGAESARTIVTPARSSTNWPTALFQ